jgi:hypothetical protein
VEERNPKLCCFAPLKVEMLPLRWSWKNSAKRGKNCKGGKRATEGLKFLKHVPGTLQELGT